MWQAASAEIKEANFLSFHKFNFQFTARFGPRKASPLFTLLILIVKRKGSERSNSLGYVFAFACYKFLSLSFLSVVTRPRQIRDASPAPKRQQMEWQKIFYGEFKRMKMVAYLENYSSGKVRSGSVNCLQGWWLLDWIWSAHSCVCRRFMSSNQL